MLVLALGELEVQCLFQRFVDQRALFRREASLQHPGTVFVDLPVQFAQCLVAVFFVQQLQPLAAPVTGNKESRFPAPPCGGRRLHGRRLRSAASLASPKPQLRSRLPSTACTERSTPLVPLTRDGIPQVLLRLRRNRTGSIACASLDSPNRGRRVAFGS